jgi:RNA polymerase sigma-70 factor, ECF subfamily
MATESNPLVDATHASWNRLIAMSNPPALLVAIRGMLGPSLLGRLEVDDVFQETLLMAWRDRHQIEWRGIAAFRRWLLETARNRVRDLADRAATLRRGAGLEQRHADLGSTLAGELYAGPCASTTPSRSASDREIAADLQAALDEVPEEWREVVRLRLFAELPLEAVAATLGIGMQGVRYRFRHGIEAYRRALRRRRAGGEEGAADGPS